MITWKLARNLNLDLFGLQNTKSASFAYSQAISRVTSIYKPEINTESWRFSWKLPRKMHNDWTIIHQTLERVFALQTSFIKKIFHGNSESLEQSSKLARRFEYSVQISKQLVKRDVAWM